MKSRHFTNRFLARQVVTLAALVAIVGGFGLWSVRASASQDETPFIISAGTHSSRAGKENVPIPAGVKTVEVGDMKIAVFTKEVSDSDLKTTYYSEAYKLHQQIGDSFKVSRLSDSDFSKFKKGLTGDHVAKQLGITKEFPIYRGERKVPVIKAKARAGH